MHGGRGGGDGGFVFYDASTHVLFWVLYALGIAMIMLLSAIVPSIVLASGGPRAGIILVAVMVLPTAVLCTLLWLSQLWRFTVISRGLILRRMGRTRQVPWPAVDHLEVDRGLYSPGGVMVVLRDGRRLRAIGTCMRLAWHRGEPIMSHDSQWHGAGHPYRVAVGIHQRYLAGEFDRELAQCGLIGSPRPR